MRKSLLSSSILLLSPLTAFALGLGDIKIHSSLNEPLDARIEIQSASFRDLESLVVRMASTQEFLKADVEKSDVLRSIRFRVKEEDNGQPYIHLTTRRILREPFVDLLIDVSWGAGRLLREYTILLDPPEIARVKPKKIMTPVIKNVPGNTPKSQIEAAQQPPISTPSITPSKIRYGSAASNSSEGTSSSNQAMSDENTAANGEIVSPMTSDTDTLWSVAYQMRPDKSISMEQMMVAILRENPRAFNRNNINGLMGGFVLRISDQAKLTELSKQEAIEEVRRQNETWKEIRQKAGYPVTDQGPSSVDIPDTLSSSKTATMDAIDEPPEVSEAKEVSEPKDETEAQLELLTSEEVSEKAKDAAVSDEEDALTEKLAAQLALTEELMESQIQENEELKARIKELENLLTKQENLVELKDENLAIMQQKQQQELEQIQEPVADVDETQMEAGTEPAETSEIGTDMPIMEGQTVEGEEVSVSSEPSVTQTEMPISDQEQLVDVDSMATEEPVPDGLQGNVIIESEEEVPDSATTEETPSTDSMQTSTVDMGQDPQAVQVKPQQDMVAQQAQPDIQQEPVKATPTPKPVVVQPKPKPAEPDLVSMLLQYKMEAGAAGGVLLLILVLLGLRKKKGKKEEDFQESILTASADQDASIEQQEPIEQMDESTGLEDETTFLSDFSSSELDSLQPDDTDSDPISEADVFIVYGRYRQAEELLKSSIAAEPNRLDYQMKLLEVYHGDKQKSAFKDQALNIKNMITSNGGELDSDDDWMKVQELAGALDINLNALADSSGSADLLGDSGTLDDDDDDDEFDLDSIDVDELERQLMASEAMLNDDFDLDSDSLGIDNIEPTDSSDLTSGSELADIDDFSLTDDSSLTDSLDENFALSGTSLDKSESLTQIEESGVADDDSLAIDLEDLGGDAESESDTIDETLSLKSEGDDDSTIGANASLTEDENNDTAIDIDLDDLELDAADDSIADLSLDDAVAELSLEDELDDEKPSDSTPDEVVNEPASSFEAASSDEFELDLDDLELDEPETAIDESNDPSISLDKPTESENISEAESSVPETSPDLDDFELDLDELGAPSGGVEDNTSDDPALDLDANTITDEVALDEPNAEFELDLDDLGESAAQESESVSELELDLSDLGESTVQDTGSENIDELELDLDDLGESSVEEAKVDIGLDSNDLEGADTEAAVSDFELNLDDLDDLDEASEASTEEPASDFEMTLDDLDNSSQANESVSDMEFDLDDLAEVEPASHATADLGQQVEPSSEEPATDLELDLSDLNLDDIEQDLDVEGASSEVAQETIGNSGQADEVQLGTTPDLDDINLDELEMVEEEPRKTEDDESISLERELEEVVQEEDHIEDIDLDSLTLEMGGSNLNADLEEMAADQSESTDELDLDALDADLNEFAKLEEDGEIDLEEIEAELGRIMEDDDATTPNESGELSLDDMLPDEEINEIDDMGNKLDLAKAYIEKGDKQAAIELLKNVMNHGDDTYKQQAQQLLDLAK